MKNKLFHTGICILLLFSIFVFPVAETATAVSAAEEPERYMVALDCDDGTFIDYDESYDIYFQPGEPLKLPKAKKKYYWGFYYSIGEIGKENYYHGDTITMSVKM